MKDSSRMAAQAAGFTRVIGLDLSDRKGTVVELDADLAIIRSHDALVRSRTGLVNTVRGQIKVFGGRLRAIPARVAQANLGT